MRPMNRGVQRGDRGDVDDPPVFPLQHLAPRRLREQERACEIDVDHLLPLVERHLLRPRAPRDAGIVDEDIEATVARHRLVDDGLHVCRVGDVSDQAFDATAEPREAFERRVQPLLAPRADHERGASFRKALGHFFAEAPRPAGHNRDPAGKREQFLDGGHVRPLILALQSACQPGGTVAPVLEVSGGGAFLIRSLNPDDLFTPEDLTDEQRLFGRTAAEFMRNEVLPHEASLYAHDWAKTRELLKKAADLDLLRLEIPADYGGLGLDLVSAAYVGEQLAINPSFGGSLGAHTSIGTLPIVYFGNDPSRRRGICPGSPAAN